MACKRRCLSKSSTFFSSFNGLNGTTHKEAWSRRVKAAAASECDYSFMEAACMQRGPAQATKMATMRLHVLFELPVHPSAGSRLG
jgi:hypothetical protein